MIHRSDKAALVFAVTLLCAGFAQPTGAAGSMPVESQIVDILGKEASQRTLTVGIMGISCSEAGAERPMSTQQQRSLEGSLEGRLEASLLRELARYGEHRNITLIERRRLDAILAEKKLQATGLTDRNAASIGGLAGLDVILLGTSQNCAKTASLSVKVIRVRDGEILGMARSADVKTTLASVTTDVAANSWNAVPLNIPSGGVVTITLSVQQGNPVSVALMTAAEFEKFKREKKHKADSSFAAHKVTRYSRSAYLAEGEYMLVLTDRTLGITSHHRSDVSVAAYLESE